MGAGVLGVARTNVPVHSSAGSPSVSSTRLGRFFVQGDVRGGDGLKRKKTKTQSVLVFFLTPALFKVVSHSILVPVRHCGARNILNDFQR